MIGGDDVVYGGGNMLVVSNVVALISPGLFVEGFESDIGWPFICG